MGKAAKAHRAKVAKRNERLKIERKQAEKQYVQMMEEKLLEFQKKFSGLTENDESLTVEEPTQEDTKPVEEQVSELEK
jgi:hypothetical protein